MTFNPNIPAANDLINQSQQQLQTNFAQSNTIFNVDHVTFDDATAADRGKHRQITFIEISDPATTGDEVALYAKDVSGATRLFFRQQSSGSVIPVSGTDPYRTAGANQTEYSTYLPGAPASTAAFIMKTGTVNITGVGGTWNLGTVTFLTPFPNVCTSVILTPVRGTSTIHAMYVNNASIGPSSFQLRTDDNSWNLVSYMAFGR